MDETDSAALSVMTLLAARGARISYSDPQVATVPASAWGGGSQLESIPLTPTALLEADCVVILTDHIGCAADNIVLHSRLVVDARNVTGCNDRKIFRLGASHRRASLRRIRCQSRKPRGPNEPSRSRAVRDRSAVVHHDVRLAASCVEG